MKRVQRVLVTLVSAFAAVYVGRLLFRQEADRASREHYQYDISAYREIPAELVRYREAKRIETGMRRLRGIAAAGKDNVYVTGDGMVKVFDGEGKEQTRFELGSTARCIALGPEGTVYVGMERHLEVYDTSGKRKASWPSLGEKAVLTSIAAGAKDVFVADYGNRVVWRFDRTGALRGKIGEGEFIIPSPYFDVAIDPDGALWAANTGERRMERYSYDGKLEKGWGESSMELTGFSGCCNPSHFAIAANGSFVTSEKGLERIKVHDGNGEFSCVVAAPDDFAEGTVGIDVAVDSAGRVLVLDPATRTVRVFEEKGNE
jgi:sugar lactone lactonase YvrE